jgi:hypothetical protein
MPDRPRGALGLRPGGAAWLPACTIPAHDSGGNHAPHHHHDRGYRGSAPRPHRLRKQQQQRRREAGNGRQQPLPQQQPSPRRPIPRRIPAHRPAIDELLALPPKWCAALADGHSVEWTFSGSGGDLYPNGADWGMVQKDAYRLLIAGVRVYCPNRLDTVTKELREAGEY